MIPEKKKVDINARIFVVNRSDVDNGDEAASQLLDDDVFAISDDFFRRLSVSAGMMIKNNASW